MIGDEGCNGEFKETTSVVVGMKATPVLADLVGEEKEEEQQAKQTAAP